MRRSSDWRTRPSDSRVARFVGHTELAMTSHTDRVRKLIALSASDNSEEARTAALTACRLIREHGLEVVEKGATRPSDSYGDIDIDSLRDLFTAASQVRNNATEQRMRDYFDKMRDEGVVFPRDTPSNKGRALDGRVIPVIGEQACFICDKKLSGDAFFAPAIKRWFHPECINRKAA